MKIIDDFLNNITMYRLVLYFLLLLLGIALILSLFGILPFSAIVLVGSAGFIFVTCWLTNRIFAYVFKIPANPESVYITASILSLIITPSIDLHRLPFIFWVSVLAISSKFILAIKNKHIFNPAAIGVLITGLVVTGSASWWIGTAWMMPAVLLGGLLIIKKIDRWDLVLSFFGVSIPIIFITPFLNNGDLQQLAGQIFLDSPILFFAFVMLTEPLTSPSTKTSKIAYGALIGLLFTPQLHIGNFYTTPEMALVLGNIFSYIVSPKEKLLLRLKEKIQLTSDTYDFVFELDRKINYSAGQYMEWTLGHNNPDVRGSRRYFTLASSPMENNLRIGVKFYPNGSSWKKSLLVMQTGQEIIASQLSGEFNLPKDQNKKIVFIAGGIGITPFRSMIRFLLDTNQKREIILLYSGKTAQDFAYKDIFEKARGQLGIKTVYVSTDTMGYIDAKKISDEIPDFKDRIFYVSGPHSMVDMFNKSLSEMGLNKSQIKTDYFPGYA